MLIECRAMQIVVQTGEPAAGDGYRESPDAAAAPVNGPPPLPPDGNGGAEVQQDVGVDVRGSGVRSRARLGS